MTNSRDTAFFSAFSQPLIWPVVVGTTSLSLESIADMTFIIYQPQLVMPAIAKKVVSLGLWSLYVKDIMTFNKNLVCFKRI